jgi:hypothetical protein
MTAEDLKNARFRKGELKKLKKSREELPKLKSKYTDMEYIVRKEFYRDTYKSWMEMYIALKKKLTLIEKIKLVIK